MLRRALRIYVCRNPIDWKNCVATEPVNGVSVQMINGVYVFDSKMAMLSKWKLWIITESQKKMVKKNLTAIHPGEFLAEILEELGLSQAAFGRAIGVSPSRISQVIKGSRPVSAELALLFGRAFAQSPQYWLNLQADYDLKIAEANIGPQLRSVHTVTPA